MLSMVAEALEATIKKKNPHQRILMKLNRFGRNTHRSAIIRNVLRNYRTSPYSDPFSNFNSLNH
jgi:hypothetical protein